MKNTLNKIVSLLAMVMIFSVVAIFGQQASGTPIDINPNEPHVDSTVLINIALGITGIVSSVFLTFIRNKFELSSTLTYFLFLIASALIAGAVVYFHNGFDTKDLAGTLSVVFIVGQAVYQTLIKGTSFGEIGNGGKPPSETNESTVLKESLNEQEADRF